MKHTLVADCDQSSQLGGLTVTESVVYEDIHMVSPSTLVLQHEAHSLSLHSEMASYHVTDRLDRR